MDLLGNLAGMDQSSLLNVASQLINSLLPDPGLAGVPPIGNSTHQCRGSHGQSSTTVYTTLAFFTIRAILFGFSLNWIRKIWGAITHKVDRLLFPTAYIAHSEPAYRWVQAWMASEPDIQRQLDHFVLQTRESSKARGKDRNLLRSRSYDDDEDSFTEQSATWESGLIIGRILPLFDQVLRIRYRGYWLWVTNKPDSRTSRNGASTGNMVITTLGYQKHALRSFLAATHAAFYSKEERELLIFHTESGEYCSDWMDPISRPSRPWSSVILPIKEAILRDMQRFLSDRETRWYAARGIPHRRGYLFHGDPGAGKTTLVTALASKLRLDIYVISICQNGMDDNKLGTLFRSCKPHSIILVEDIDRIFSDNQFISTGTQATPRPGDKDGTGSSFVLAPPKDGKDEDSPSGEANGEAQKAKLEPCVVTMSGLLNAIDGVSSQEGCLLIASTNHPDKLDPALIRAGRFDVRVPFHSATPQQAQDLFLHFFPAEDSTSADGTTEPMSEVYTEDDEDLLIFKDDPVPILLSKSELEALAAEFALALFPNGVEGGAGGVEGTRLAMASMQAYLLNFKENPKEAVGQAAAWAKSAEKGGLMLSSPVMAEFAE